VKSPVTQPPMPCTLGFVIALNYAASVICVYILLTHRMVHTPPLKASNWHKVRSYNIFFDIQVDSLSLCSTLCTPHRHPTPCCLTFFPSWVSQSALIQIPLPWHVDFTLALAPVVAPTIWWQVYIWWISELMTFNCKSQGG
jgi:hypothetical protein